MTLHTTSGDIGAPPETCPREIDCVAAVEAPSDAAQQTAMIGRDMARPPAGANRAVPSIVYLNVKFALWTLPSRSLKTSWRQVFAQPLAVLQA